MTTMMAISIPEDVPNKLKVLVFVGFGFILIMLFYILLKGLGVF